MVCITSDLCLTQHGVNSHRRCVAAGNFRFKKKKRDSTISKWKQRC